MPAKRGRLAFQPPRPGAGKTAKPKPTPRRTSVPAASSASDNDDHFESTAGEKLSDTEDDSFSTKPAPPSTQDPPSAIPPQLLTRLVNHHLEKKEDGVKQIGTDANALVGKYMDVFVREAIARAAFERSQADEGMGGGDGFLEVSTSSDQECREDLADERLQVEDLEKLAPQLLLDF
ncbi:MAG: hypothetical protein L6R35_005810 [Caloplaca aegaea]|nr:MAG: hypothetical protein L6R35_005810 [Caloplaca aegaea]